VDCSKTPGRHSSTSGREVLLFVSFVRQASQTAFNVLVVVFGLLFEELRFLVQAFHVLFEFGQFLLATLSVPALVTNVLRKRQLRGVQNKLVFEIAIVMFPSLAERRSRVTRNKLTQMFLVVITKNSSNFTRIGGVKKSFE